MILFICKDLMFVSKVQNTCRQRGKTITTVNTVDAGLEKLSENGQEYSQIFLDLKSITENELLEKVAEAAKESATPIIAYGPHVKVELLSAAKEAGIENVLTQGQFHRDFSNWI